MEVAGACSRTVLLALVAFSTSCASSNAMPSEFPSHERPEQAIAVSSSGSSTWEKRDAESDASTDGKVWVDPGPHAEGLPAGHTSADPSTLSDAPTSAPSYSRSDWRHWTDEDGDCQDTRQEVLIAESEVAVTYKSAKRCKVASGKWTCPYTGEVFTNPRKLDVDHMVPLGNAHASGGASWSAERKRAYANELGDPVHLVAVSAGANRSKGARGPEEWMPDSGAACEYVAQWVSIKQKWKLGVNARERKALYRWASQCEN